MTATGRTTASWRCEAWGAVDFLWQDFVAAKRWPGDRIPATAHRSTWEGSRDEDGTSRGEEWSAEQQATQGIERLFYRARKKEERAAATIDGLDDVQLLVE
jgi:hypothetical protein